MKIKTISLNNFKCFELLELEFNERFNVIIGDNATGKTSILDAISFALGTFFIGVRKVTGDSAIEIRTLRQHEKRKVLTENALHIQLPFKVALCHTLQDKEYRWTRETDKVTGGSTSYKDANAMIKHAERLCKNIYEANDNTTLPLIAYYGTARLFSDTSQRHRLSRATARTEGYAAALDPHVLQERFISWFADYEDSILKFAREKSLYDAFVNTITTLVPNWQKIHYSWTHNTILGYMADGTWTSFDMLSSGYRSIIRLSADIAYRAIKLNPHLRENAVLLTEGVVLIDELDMHLHPSWQRDVVQLLKDAFPRIQFIATTHSPFIIQSMQSHELIKLAECRVESTSDNTNMKGLEDIVADEMDVGDVRRSKRFLAYQRLAERYFSLLNSDTVSEASKTAAKQALDNIETEFMDNPVLAYLLATERKLKGS
ncbi:AAA family ATPase [Acerihabitans arboris]|uniref:AAA family ATPase n=1 Tax=Acerihabitans arboris TaxID=2691583 RepID=A0A845SIU5_9GAMM|nr:AAA family ATPase [Acerihabitans arboris]NDL62568.1 AAA family ATPase [Acerihabitans arboris]